MAAKKEKDWERIRRFFEGQMSDAEIRDFNRNLEEDEGLLNALKFEFALREGQHRERREQYRKRLKGSSFPMWLIGLAVLLALGLGSWWAFSRPAHPFTQQEGQALLAEIIEDGQRKGILDVVAGSGANWRQLLLEGMRNPEKWEEALFFFEQEIAQAGDCKETLLEGYSGLILLLVKQQYTEAQNHLDCALREEPRLEDALRLPMVLNQAGLGNYEEARQLMVAYGISPGRLPEKARQLLGRE